MGLVKIKVFYKKSKGEASLRGEMIKILHGILRNGGDYKNGERRR